jgi:hypothetical protein
MKEDQPPNKKPFWIVIGLFFAVVFLSAIYSGHISLPGKVHSVIYLKQDPIVFWISVCFSGAVALFCFYSAFKSEKDDA